MKKKNADAVQVDVLAENQVKLDNYDKSIKAAQKRRRKVIIESKLYTYDKLSQLYGGAEGQALLDAVTAEHTLIGKLTESGMSYADIEEMADSPAVNVSGKNSSHTYNGYSNDDDNDQIDGQTSMF